MLEQSCETIAFWCKTGKRYSGQTEKAGDVLAVATGASAVWASIQITAAISAGWTVESAVSRRSKFSDRNLATKFWSPLCPRLSVRSSAHPPTIQLLKKIVIPTGTGLSPTCTFTSQAVVGGDTALVLSGGAVLSWVAIALTVGLALTSAGVYGYRGFRRARLARNQVLVRIYRIFQNPK